MDAWSVPKVLSVGSASRLRLTLPCTVMLGSRLLSATRIVVEASTFTLDDKLKAERALRKAGHTMLDCPISGTGAQAKVKDIVVYASGDTYAAIAYSPATGKWGYGNNYGSRGAAERAALQNCPEPDARIVTWVHNGFCALALGDDRSCWGIGYSWGNGASNTAARNFALQDCRGRTTGAHIVLCVYSGNLQPEVHR